MDSKLLISIIDFLPDATFVINNEKKVIAWNRAMEEMTGVRREDILGKGDYAYAVPFYGESRPILIDIVMNESRDTEVLYDFVKSQGNAALYAETYVPSLNNGTGAYLCGTAALLLDDKGNCQGAIESIRDITERKNIEIKLRDSEEKLRTIFDQTFEFMGLLTIDGILLAANKIAMELVGTTVNDVLGKPFWETPWWSHSETAQYKLKKAVQSASSGEPVRFETTHIDRNGKVCYVDFSLRPVLDGKGNIIYLNAEGHDITEIKEVGEALKQSEEKFRLLFEKSVDPVLLLDNGVYVDCNDAALKLMHCSDKNQLIGLCPSDFSPETQPDGSLSSEKAREFIETALREGTVRFEWMRRTFDGEEFWIEASLTAIPIQGKQVLYAVLRDIRDRKESEKALEGERKRFLTLTEEAPFGIVLFDEKGQYNYINTKFKEMFGYDLHDIPDGKTWFRKAYPNSEYRHNAIKTWLHDIKKVKDDPSLTETGHWTFTVTCKDNTQKFISLITVQLPTREYLMTCEDITERKTTEEALKNREAELEIKSTNLEEVNIALKILIKERENDKIDLEEKILSNVKELILPYIEKLKTSRLDPNHMTYVNIIDTNLNDIVSPFLQKMALKFAHLTPTEIQIANLIKSGNTTKEIGISLNMSSGAINFHRNNIRKKLGLNKSKVNLRSYLVSL